MNLIGIQVFTAAQIAAAIGRKRESVARSLSDTPETSTVVVSGNTAKAWSFSSLPAELQNELQAAAHRRGLRSLDELLIDPPESWQPPIAWHSIPEDFRERAQKLCDVLASVMVRQHDLSGPDLMELARTRYRQYFGNEIEPDRLRYVMDRATKRDGGFQQWQRPDLYLDDVAFKPTALESKTALEFPELLEVVEKISNKSAPSDLDRRSVFPAAFRAMESHAAVDQRDRKQRLIKLLYQYIPGLYRPNTGTVQTANKPLLALRRMFNLKHVQWVEEGRPFVLSPDMRANNSGRKGYEHKECDTIIKAHAARLRGEQGKTGNLDLAIKMLSEHNKICADCAFHYHPDRISNSARERLTPNKLQVAYFKGQEEIRKIAPTHHTHWDIEPGDRFVIDDMTTNELAWDEVNGKTVSGQAQMLFTEDEYSSYPLPFFLYFGAPTSRTITLELYLVLSRVGLPHLELLTEKGVFASRRISGERSIQHQTDFRELQNALNRQFQFKALPDEMLAEIRKRDLGLRDPAFRLRISHAHSPQIKTVERSFFEFQKSASRLPGFAGFNQRNEKPRVMQDFDRRVKSGKEHPGNEYLHIGDLKKNYENIFAEIAARPVNGVRHRGRTPMEVWQEAVSKKPLRKLPAEIEAFFATQRIPQKKVQTQGICIALDKFEKAFYFNEHTGPFVGRNVAVRVNYDIPEYIYIEHPDTGVLLKVQRAFTKRTTATPEEIAEVNRARRAHITGALAQVGNVENLFTATVERSSEHSARDIKAGAQILTDAQKHKQQQHEKRRLAKLAGTLGTVIPSNPRNLDRVAEGLELERQVMEEIARQQAHKEGQT